MPENEKSQFNIVARVENFINKVFYFRFLAKRNERAAF